ncbi:MAG: hypothetical protein II412_06725, partial [Clostridia bacterium]|nr:hypothetical protein [Clostridia bacterium]
MKKGWIILLTAAMMLIGCTGNTEVTQTVPTAEPANAEQTAPTAEPIEVESVIPTEKIEGSSLYVKKVEDLPDDFILGMDASAVIAEEQSGVKYYNFAGEEQDVLRRLPKTASPISACAHGII